jgi:flagellar motor switch/type III secretory pathway protein FliN
MAHASPETLTQLVQACKANAQALSALIAQTLDRQVTVEVGAAGSIDPQALPEAFAGPGLAILLTKGGEAAVFAVPEASGFLPAWCGKPEGAGLEKLAALSEAAGKLLLPEQHAPNAGGAVFVSSLAAAVARAGVSSGAARISLWLCQPDGKRVEAGLIWPVARPATLFGPAAKTAAAPPPPPSHPTADLGCLPSYTRSLLRVKLPVLVTLAEKKQTLRRILELAPGSIIQFDKSCEDMLELAVGQQPVALGEAVKVGDKFGLRVTSMVLPGERFVPVRRART